MDRTPYSGQILGSNCHPYNRKKIYTPMKITYNIFPLSKWQICGQTSPTTLPGKDGNQHNKKSKWQRIVTYNTGSKKQSKDEFR